MSELTQAIAALVSSGEVKKLEMNDGGVIIEKKPQRYLDITLQIKDKRNDSVEIKRHYMLPAELESAACWDVLETIYEFSKKHEEESARAWNLSFGRHDWITARFPLLHETPNVESKESQLSDFKNFRVRKARDSGWWVLHHTDERGERTLGTFSSREAALRAGMNFANKVESKLPTL
jgi:hypothetical protein